MRTIEVTFIKQNKLSVGNQIPQFAKQTLLTDKERFEIPIPAGYQIVSILEILPQITIKEDNHAN